MRAIVLKIGRKYENIFLKMYKEPIQIQIEISNLKLFLKAKKIDWKKIKEKLY